MHRRLVLTGFLTVFAPDLAQAAARPIQVFAAASLREAVEEIATTHTRRTGRVVRCSFAGSNVLARQIEQGAPADLVITADLEWMDWLAQRRLIQPRSRRIVAANRLVLVARADDPVRLSVGPNMPLAAALNGGRLAVADAAAPAGRYARAALTALGVWPSVADRVAPAADVRGALAFVARGEAPLGVVYATDALAEPRVRVVGRLPAASHPPIVYPAALVAGAAPQAAALLGDLTGPQGAAAFRRRGFVLP